MTCGRCGEPDDEMPELCQTRCNRCARPGWIIKDRTVAIVRISGPDSGCTDYPVLRSVIRDGHRVRECRECAGPAEWDKGFS